MENKKEYNFRFIHSIYGDSTHGVTIEELYFSGSCSISRNGKYILAWETHHLDENRYLLFEDRTLIATVQCRRPHKGFVLDNGYFIINYSRNAVGSETIVLEFNKKAEVIYERFFHSKVKEISLSQDQQFIAIEFSDGIDKYSRNIAFINKNLNKEIVFQSEIPSPLCFYIKDDEGMVYFCYTNSRAYKYTFDGIFLDRDIYEKDVRSIAEVSDVIFYVKHELREKGIENIEELKNILESKLNLQNACYYCYRDKVIIAKGYQLLGNIQETLNQFNNAINSYKCALSWHHKIGVNRNLDKLIRISKTGKSL